MIKEITFELIREYWSIYLWPEYVQQGLRISRVNTTTQKDYFYKVLKHINQEQVEAWIKPTYIAYFFGAEIVGVESGYKTNTNYYRLRGLWVNESYRRQGIATEMIDYLANKSEERYLWTIPREKAVGFYKKYGFEITGKSAKTVYGQNYFAVKERKHDRRHKKFI